MANILLFATVNHISLAPGKSYESAPPGIGISRRQHCLEDNFDDLLRKGQPRYADQIAGAPRPRLGVGFFAHLARDRERRINIEDIERLFHHVVEARPETRQKL